MIFDWLKRSRTPSPIEAVVEALVNELLRRYPPVMASGEGRRLSPQAVTRILESVIDKAVAKSQEMSLGVVGKAKLGTDFKYALKAKGYPEKFVDVMTEALIVYVSRNSKG
jgi:hypothetical protein